MSSLYTINGTDPIKMTISMLNFLVPLKGIRTDTKIGIKPNLVCAKPSSSGATTHSEIVEGIIIYLFSNGYKNICILEGSWVGGSTVTASKICGYDELCKKYNVKFIDTKKDKTVKKSYDRLDIEICESVLDIDYLINVPLIKGHCQTDITCALKNLKGIIPDSEKRRFHSLGLHKPIAYLNKIIKQDLIIADAICPDPYFEEGGRPKTMNMIAAGFDPVLMDSYAAKILGYGIDDIEYINIAQDIGVGKKMSDSSQIISIDNNGVEIIVKKKDKKYLNIIEDASACSACYSNLVSALDKLDEEGLTVKFPEQVCIGQYYRGYEGNIGIGDCTGSFKKHIKGCPPTRDEILEFLKSL